MEPSLYIVSTPIGNLEDITLRALRVLSEVDFILCEDTRVTKKLLDKYKINTPLISYHQHSKLAKIDKIVDLLKKENNLALVTDAGTPGISDPGNELISHLIKKDFDLRIIPIPGPSAIASALSVAGFSADEFLFLGFLPHKKGRQTMVKEIILTDKTVVVYESCHRIIKFLNELMDNGGQDLRLVVCRELTKMFESVYRGAPAEILAILKQAKTNTKGEFAVVISK